MSAPFELPTAPPANGHTLDAGPSEISPADEALQQRRFRIEGMDCGACAQTIGKSVRALDGITSADVSFGAASMTVTGGAPDAAIVATVTRAGFRARPIGEGATDLRAGRWQRDARSVSLLLSLGLLLIAVIASLASAPRVVAEPLYLLSMAVGGWPVAQAAMSGLRRRVLDMNVLMGLAAVGAVGIGAYAEGAWVLVLFAVGTALEAMALARSRQAVAALSELAPANVRVLGENGERWVPLGDVVAGDRVLVGPGERIAVDGIVDDGSSSVDQSPVTGESVPVDVRAGDTVFAGSLNVHGALGVTATAAAAQSTLSRINALVEEAQGSRAPAERLIDRFARIYTPIVFGSAILLITVPPLVFGGDFGTWVYRALALLIVACPCSLVISIPVAVVSAVGGGARRGVLIKGGQALEALAGVDTVAIDKTGTLTLGLPVLAAVVPLGEADQEQALRLMAALEQHSEHPLAAAIVRAAREQDLSLPATSAFLALPGQGAQAIVDDRELWAGGPRMARKRLGTDPPILAELHDGGRTALLLGEGDRLLAAFGLIDQVRPEAAAFIDALGDSGVRKVIMLTGDHDTVARSVATAVGITDYQAGMLPADKLQAVRDLQSRGAHVAMVGDGINDTPALAAADIGVVMGAAGSDAALAAADVALLSDRLDRLPLAIATARRARKIMGANVIASLLVKGACVLLAPFGLITLVVAIAADVGMSLLVTGNALRLLGPTSPATSTQAVAEAPATISTCATDGCCT